MFDIAWSELFVIVVVALVVVGPKDLPKLMRKAGQWAGRARAMADQFRRSFDDMARQAELDELRSEVGKLRQEAAVPMSDLDYQSLGIPENPLPAINPLTSPIEEVGAAPPAPSTADLISRTAEIPHAAEVLSGTAPVAETAGPPGAEIPAIPEAAVPAAAVPAPHSSGTA